MSSVPFSLFGTILVLVYSIADIILSVIGLFVDEVDSISNMVAGAIVDAFFNVDVVVDNIRDEDRLGL